MATTIVFNSLNYIGSPSADDMLAANKLVREENQRIAAQNAILAAQDPPGTPIPLFSTTGAGLKASVLTILTRNLTNWWASYAAQAIADKTRLTPAEEQQILGFINIRLDNGETVASIITDIAA